MLSVLILALGLAVPARRKDKTRVPRTAPSGRRCTRACSATRRSNLRDGVITLDTPKRAEDAAIVPLAIRAQFPQTKERQIETIWLIIDNNPSPIAAVFHFTLESGRADIETRVRIEEYTYVRAIARTNDGKLYMAVQLRQGVGRLLGAGGQGCDRRQGQPRQDAPPRR